MTTQINPGEEQGSAGVTIYQRLFDSVLSRLDPETAHRSAITLTRGASRIPSLTRYGQRRLGPHDPALHVEAMGLRFSGPLGLAAGFDINAESIDALAALGFAFVEVGGVTAQPQPGNPRPRIHRLKRDRAIVNRKGFANDGAAALAARLARRRQRRGALPVVVGVNIAKTKVVPDSHIIADYQASTALLAPHVDYLVVNVSSPNTPRLRDLQAVDRLAPLLTAVREQADKVMTDRTVPILVKIAPDLSDDDVTDIAKLALETGLDGIVATNTTVSRAGLRSSAAEIDAAGPGGLSGPPLRARSMEVLQLLHAAVGDRLTLVSVGGISTAKDAAQRLRAGATLVQAYTGFVYGGPAWPRRMHRELAGLIEENR
jgi:dihydroorotate dehydrogenase